MLLPGQTAEDIPSSSVSSLPNSTEELILFAEGSEASIASELESFSEVNSSSNSSPSDISSSAPETSAPAESSVSLESNSISGAASESQVIVPSSSTMKPESSSSNSAQSEATSSSAVSTSSAEQSPIDDVFTITATSGENGAISPNGTLDIAAGSTQVFTFLPSSGYVLDTVTVDDVAVPVSENIYTFENVTGNHTIHATFKLVPPAPNLKEASPSPSLNVAYYDFESFNGSNMLVDGTANQNNGSIENAAAVEGVFGGTAMKFSANTVVTIPDAPSLDLGTNTISVWLKPDAYGDRGGSTPMLIAKGTNSAENYSLGIYQDNEWGVVGEPLFSYLSDAGRQLLNHCPTIPADEWSHIVLTYDESAMRLYINGELAKEQKGNGRLVSNDHPLTLGNGYKGLMDELRIYDNALNESEVKKLFVNEELPPVATYSVELRVDGVGKIDPEGIVNVLAGSSLSFALREVPGYHLESLTVNGQPVSHTDFSYTFTDIQEDKLIIATFVEDDYTQSPGNTTYYLDSENGSDDNDGTTPETAWRTVKKASAMVYAPGDKILLKSGSVFTGQLWPKGSGEEGNPIEISWYGYTDPETSPKPIINGNKLVRVAKRHGTVLLVNQEYWEIRNLEITNDDDFSVDCYTGTVDDNADGVCVVIEADLLPGENDDRIMNHIYVEDCYIHDIDSPTHKWLNVFSGGVTFNVYGSKLYKSSYFQDVRIANNRIVKCDLLAIPACFNAMPMDGFQDMLEEWDGFSKDIYIGHNYTEDIGQGSIDITDSKNVVAEYNVVNGHAKRYSAVCVALYPWRTENCVMQYNEVYGGAAQNQDGTAFDFDAGLKDCVYQYNYTHDNPCGWMLYMGRNDNDIARYNLSIENGDWIIKYFLFSNSSPSYFLNNVFIYDSARTRFHEGTFFGQPAYFYNNIFYNTNTEKTSSWFSPKLDSNGQPVLDENGNVIYNYGTAEFYNNCFYEASGIHAPDEPQDAHKITTDPMFKGPFTVGQEIDNHKLNGFEYADRFQLQENSPLIDAGAFIPQLGKQDFFGTPLYYGAAPDIGIHEAQQGEPTDPFAQEYTITSMPHKFGTLQLPATAHLNDIVTITVKPTPGYTLVEGSLKVNDGKVRVSNDNTFIMPAENVTVTADFIEAPLSLGKAYSCSDVHPSFKVENAFDGKLDNRWAAGDSVVPKWLEVDFGKETTFNKVFVKEWEVSGYNGSRVDNWQIQYWNNGTWEVAAEGNGIHSSPESTDMEMTVRFTPVTSTKMRFAILSLKEDQYGGREPSINEILVYNEKMINIQTPVSPLDGGVVTGAGSYLDGSTVTLIAEPHPDYRFAGWYEEDKLVFSETEFVFTATTDLLLEARFEEIIPNTWKVKVEGGTTDRTDGLYAEGETVTITATVPSGKEFVNWTSEQVTLTSPAVSKTTFVMPANDVFLTAIFRDVSGSGSTSNSGDSSSGSGSSSSDSGSSSSNSNTPGGDAGNSSSTTNPVVNTPQTGDATPLLVLAVILGISVVGMVALILWKKRQTKH